MKGILSDELFNHYALLVGGIYLLSKESISPADLSKAEMPLVHFVEMFDAYYGMIILLLLWQQWITPFQEQCKTFFKISPQ